MDKETILQQIQQEYDNALEYRSPVITEWQANEEMLYLKKPKTISKRANINLNLMHGFVYTFLSKIKAQTSISFKPVEDADLRKSKKVQALFDVETSQTRENWRFKDLAGKKSGMISGRVIDKIVTQSPYKHRRYRVDHYDFLIDPSAGGFDIENALYLGQDNIFKTKSQLESGDYDQEAVKELVSAYSEDTAEKNDNRLSEKANRFTVLGLNPDLYNIAKGGKYKLLDWYTTIDGVRYNILCDLAKKIIVKQIKLEEAVGIYDDNEHPRWPFRSWAYFPDEFNFWSIAPMSVVRDNFQTRNIVVNQAVDNNEDQNKPPISYNPNVYNNPDLLRRDASGKLIPIATNDNPAAGMFIHPVNNIYDPIKLSQVLEEVAGKVSGVTPEAQGAGQGDQKVGIYYGNQAEIADRMALFENSYAAFNIGLAQLYLDGLRDKLEEKIAVRIIGENGAQAEELMKDDLTSFDINISGGLAEAQNDAMEKKTKLEWLGAQLQNPLINPKWVTEQQLVLLGYDHISVKRALEKNDMNEDLLSEASGDIQKLLNGEEVTPNPKATPEYMQKILDFYQKTEMKADQEQRFIAYLDALQVPATDNTIRQAEMDAMRATREQLPQQPIGAFNNPEGLQPNTMGATNARSQEMSRL